MPIRTGRDTFQTRQTLVVGDREYDYFSLKAAEKILGDVSRLPFSLKVVLENLLRNEDGRYVTLDDIRAVGAWLQLRKSSTSSGISIQPARVLMPDVTGIPALVDLASMRDAVGTLGGNPAYINPMCQVDLVVDHALIAEETATASAIENNLSLEFERNDERYTFLRWGEKAFSNLRVVPPGAGICHQINLEYLARVVCVDNDEAANKPVAYMDTVVGADIHTTMINCMGVLGWGVGGIEAESTMLGQPSTMLIPEVIGVKLSGKLRKGANATDLALTITQLLKKKGVTGKFVEFFGGGVSGLTVPDRAVISNMAPEYDAICSMFPIDEETIRYLKLSGREPEHAQLVETYAKEQGMWCEHETAAGKEPLFTETVEIDLGTVEPSVAGPRLPQSRTSLPLAAAQFESELVNMKVNASIRNKEVPISGKDYSLKHGAVVIASITSCTNTANPELMVAAGLLARNARLKGLSVKPWVKTSFAPGSAVVSDYLVQSGLQLSLDELGFNVVGYGCAVCIGNSGKLKDEIASAVERENLTVCSVLSGNRNHDGHVNSLCKANYLVSPPLVIAYAIAGSMAFDLATQPLGVGADGKSIFLKDIWPSAKEIEEIVKQNVTSIKFRNHYATIFAGTDKWQKIGAEEGLIYKWAPRSTYIKPSPLFSGLARNLLKLKDVKDARALAIFGDAISTEQISPSGEIKHDSPTGQYLIENGVAPSKFDSYGARRGNHEVMVRGMFSHPGIKNEIMGGAEGGMTKHVPSGDIMSIYNAATRYQKENVPLVIFAGKDYGTGSSRDWAAKGTRLLGVRAVVAESFERIHRSNLVGMGVVPLEFKGNMTRADLELTGEETFNIVGLSTEFRPHMDIMLTINRRDSIDRFMMLCRIDTDAEVEYFKNGGVLPYIVRNLMQ